MNSLADSHVASLGFNFEIGSRGFFVLFPSKMRPVCLSCFSLLLFFSAFRQIIAEPVDQFQSSGTEGESCETWSFRRKQVLWYVQGSWKSAFPRESDQSTRSRLPSHPLDFAPAQQRLLPAPLEGFMRDPLGTGTWRAWEAPLPPMAQWGLCQGIYSEILLRNNLLSCAWVSAV